MEAVMLKSFLMPLRKFTSCVTETPKQDIWTKHRGSKCQRSKLGGHDPAVPRVYQPELKRERKLREAMNTQKNAERAAMRAQFRRKYKLPTNAEDSRRVGVVGGKVVLPRNLAKMVRSETSEKKESFNLLSVFQSLSFSTGLYTHNTQPNMQHNTQHTKTDHTAECRVM